LEVTPRLEGTIRFPDSVAVCEVGPRDGLQNEPANVPTPGKIRLIESLTGAGIRRMEATSFVAPKWIPNLADAGEVLTGIRREPGVAYTALVPNLKGLERALAARVDGAVLFLSASETHSQKNINKSIDQALEAYAEVAAQAKAAGVHVKGAISMCFGCPFEGDVDPAVVVRIASKLLAMGADEVSLSDTGGTANPRLVAEVTGKVAEHVPVERISLHFHDTRGTALANVLAGLQAGVRIYDASIGGLGGCPYSKGATGNVATEDLVHMLHEMGIATGIDLPRLIECARLAGELTGRPAGSRLTVAGPVDHRPTR
jgi:hydroxymethylglutaryl-CoA lyase